ncbi:arsenate reductase [Mariprofundus micogutta]|uniref:Arsenate reductase n=2 Tax=Mariprofundus micogutta TaxID=1921010 RepID=A0A1L8CMJ4_9PROT|nr:arsenate reductase [Mariprofundus micogutta]
MAEGWLKALGGHDFEVYSAGIEAHGKNPRALAVMQEAGVDITRQESEILDPGLFHQLDLLVTVCGHADTFCPELPVTCKKEHWPFDDPAQADGTEAEVMAEFRRVRDQIRVRIEGFVNQA